MSQSDHAPDLESDDCTVVLGRVHQFLDHELDEASCDEIRAHLDACEPCLEDFDAEQAIKQLVSRCCRGEAAPEGLKSSIMRSLADLRRDPA
ncbi:mycothiol system anti-sigma-R factor [Mariniluteicoccus flavus]